MRRTLLVGLLSCAACQTTGEAGPHEIGEQAHDFTPQGSVSYSEWSASFDDTRVVSPRANMSKRADGSWAGRLQDAVIDADPHGNSLKGVDLILSWEDTPTGVTVTGSLQGKLRRFEVTDQYVLVRSDRAGSFKLNRHDRENFGAGNFHFTGKAADVHPPEPQFALMMLAAFN